MFLKADYDMDGITDYLIVLSPAGEAHCQVMSGGYPRYWNPGIYVMGHRDSVCCSPVFYNGKRDRHHGNTPSIGFTRCI